jgi:hypothetical protein
MARPYDTKGIFGKPSDFDVDEDGEYCGIIGGEMADRNTVGPVWDWRPDMGNPQPAKNARVLGQLSHSECTALRGKA